MSSARRLRRAGDAARDRGDWEDAEHGYRAYLRRAPKAAGIWVQLGHAIKEQGRAAEAMDAYRRATQLAPSDADPWLHLGFLAKKLELKADALEAFEQSYRLGGERESYEQLLLLGGAADPLADRPSGAGDGAATRPAGAATFLIIDDLLKFLADHVTLSGIQRVQVGLIESLLGEGGRDYQFVTSSTVASAAGVTFWLIPRDAVRAIIDYAVAGAAMERKVLDRLLAATVRASRHVVFMPGDIVFFPGAFWIVEKTGATCAALKRAGAKIGVYVYDLIPISHPEFCHETLVEFFARAFTEIVQFVDFFATISEYVADVLRGFLTDIGSRPIPVTALPLAHFLTISDQHQPPSAEFAETFARTLKGKPFALYVSTLEGRKNHLYVLNVWRELGRQGIDMPDLIFLGRKGWRSEGLFEFLDSTKHLYGKVHLMHDVADGDLAFLYRSCEFSLFTSFVEGWGLPVGESLVFGRPCVASDSCSIPEVGGDLVDYVDPLNTRDGQRVIGRLVTDRAYHAERVRQIETEFRPRPWSEVAEGLTRIIGQARAAPAIAAGEFRIPAGHNYSFRWRMLDINDLSNLLEYPAAIVLGPCFYNQEPFGVWMRGTSGTIDLPTEAREGETVLVGIEILASPWSTGASVALSSGKGDMLSNAEDAVLLSLSGQSPVVLTAELPVGQGGVVSVRLDVFDASGKVQPDGREYYLGVLSASYLPAATPMASALLLGTFVNTRRFGADGGNGAVRGFPRMDVAAAG